MTSPRQTELEAASRRGDSEREGEREREGVGGWEGVGGVRGARLSRNSRAHTEVAYAVQIAKQVCF